MSPTENYRIANRHFLNEAFEEKVVYYSLKIVKIRRFQHTV